MNARERAEAMRREKTLNDPTRASLLHQEGAVQFGVEWLRANQEVVSLFREFSLEPDKHRALGASIAWKMCNPRLGMPR